MIRQNVELEARLIDDLLDLTRITHGKLSLDLKAQDVHVLVKEAIATVRSEVARKQIVLQLELGASPSRVLADEVRLQQVFWNLLRNAVKFTPDQGTITVTSRSDPAAGTVVVSVADTGIGLSPGEIERIYDAFAQGDHATHGAHRFGGLGLGLTISKNLVEQHGGQLVARSEGLGKGATFVVELPLAKADLAHPGASGVFHPAEPIENPAPLAGAETGPRLQKILVVEDHAPTRAAVAMLLRRRRYEVTTAASLTEARALVAGQVFDFLISDIGLPDGSGFDLMREMRATHEVRGIALTGYGMEKDVDRSREAGFVAHLTKPIAIQALDKALAELDRSVPAVTNG